MTDPWFAATLELSPDITSSESLEADLLGDALTELGAEGLEWRDTSSPIVLVAAIELPAAEAEGLPGAIEAALAERKLPAKLISVEPFQEIDWSTHWRHHFTPLSFGPLWVVPTWLEPPAEAEHILRIDPSSAFGTGLHPTTALCTEWVVERRPTRMLDVGTGTGLLALAAAHFGAERAMGVDNDPEAVRVSIENRDLNGISPDTVPLSETPVGELEETFEVVVANILAGPLVALAKDIRARVAPGGELVLSGLLERQLDEVCAAYVAEGLTRGEAATRGEWARVHLHAPE